jgi:glucose/arabinose dehydrogenase
VTARRIDRRRFVHLTATAGVFGTAGCLGSGGAESDPEASAPDDADPEAFETEELTREISQPWGMAFLDESALLVTEKAGGLQLLDTEHSSVESIDGTPEVYDAGQGGLLDLAVHPEFPDQSWLYLTYAARNEAGETATHLGRGRLDRDAGTLEAFEQIHVAEPFVDSTSHCGSRVVFGEDEKLYMTVGDRQFKEFGPDHVAQDRSNELGTTLRLEPDGTIPDDNPFVDDSDTVDSIFSYGHRNAQGMTVHPKTGTLWQSEHGERDGDEINIVEAGKNYGWPIASEACKYGTDERIGVSHSERDDVTAPVYYWECGSGGFPPAGMTFYDGEAFPAWQGDLFVGNLAGSYLGRFTVDGREFTEVEPLLAGRDWRLRDVAVAPESGHLYVAVDAAEGPIARLIPE